jgi:hypothetical protein
MPKTQLNATSGPKSRQKKDKALTGASLNSQVEGGRASKRKHFSSQASEGSAHSDEEKRDERQILRDLLQSPATKYIASGLATALLTRFAKRLSDHYPEISQFIRENLDMLEERMAQYRTEFYGSEIHKH